MVIINVASKIHNLDETTSGSGLALEMMKYHYCILDWILSNVIFFTILGKEIFCLILFPIYVFYCFPCLKDTPKQFFFIGEGQKNTIALQYI